MTIRFAAAHPVFTALLGPAAPGAKRRRPANDNAADDGAAHRPDFGEDGALRAALLHFAAHGLGAARDAASRAELALRADDEDGYRRWSGICAMLDSRMAAALARRLRDQTGRDGR